ncbi:hypothetical protein GOP47_0022105 [Adiantum capillus-veneris]|uniref:SAP domain-containing protein n=1 Tax=Adiantum capillus-veneris TaxID=13818 RepID=A0A9D4U9N0_ADICA|nr:hypothetical protein GOP47_0022105 [Adiantum capillus-veneris]
MNCSRLAAEGLNHRHDCSTYSISRGEESMAGRLLLDLPSKGYFSSATNAAISAPMGLRLYVCDHETSPPEHQVIRTDRTNILIRSLTLKRSKNDSKGKQKQKPAGDSNRGKRPAERAADDKIVSKRANTSSGLSNNNRKENGGACPTTEKDFQGYTVEKLRSLLKERNLPRTGKKDELIARLKQSLMQ